MLTPYLESTTTDLIIYTLTLRFLDSRRTTFLTEKDKIKSFNSPPFIIETEIV